MEIYRVVLDIAGLNVYDIGTKFSNVLKKRYNMAEHFMEDVRLRIDNTLLSRKGAVFVCSNVVNAHDWYQKIDVNQHLNYYVYKLSCDGHIQWHNSVFYESVFLSYYYRNRVDELLVFSRRENAEKYWTTEIEQDDSKAEGLFWGEAKILERTHYDCFQKVIL